MMFTALAESKHQLLQKMVGTTDRPASKQLEVHYQIYWGEKTKMKEDSLSS